MSHHAIRTRTGSLLLLLWALSPTFGQSTDATPKTQTLSDIHIRDPFILADAPSQTYYLYAQMGHRPQPNRAKGVEVYTSRDLQQWEGPQPVFVVPDDFWARAMVWAPEVHAYQGKYYLFVTFTSRDTLPPVAGRPRQIKRGTQVLVADTPRGPFQPFANQPHTPSDWMALDGTLWVEDGKPWMVFCHEWVQVTDGTMECVRLAEDLSKTEGTPQTLFRASEAPWMRAFGAPGSVDSGNVTDGPFLYRTRTGRLLMIWSSFGDHDYAVGLAASQSGSLLGPWQQIEKPLYATDGGHGMIFQTFDGQLMLCIHQPNSGGAERARLLPLRDTGDLLEMESPGETSR